MTAVDVSPAMIALLRQRAAAAGDPASGYTSEDYAGHIRTEFSTFRWLLEPMLETAGFEIVSAEFGGRLYGACTCVKSS